MASKNSAAEDPNRAEASATRSTAKRQRDESPAKMIDNSAPPEQKKRRKQNPTAPEKLAEAQLIGKWQGLFSKYNTDAESPHRIRLIEQDTPNSEWAGWLREGVKMVVLLKTLSTNAGREKLTRIESLCQELLIPLVGYKGNFFSTFSPSDPATETSEQPSIIALCLTSVKPEHNEEFQQLRDLALAKRFVLSTLKGAIKVVLKLWPKVFDENDNSASTASGDLPIVFGLDRVQRLMDAGKAHLVLGRRHAYVFSTTVCDNPLFPILKKCYEKRIPFVWGTKKDRLGALLGTESVACITDGHARFAEALKPIYRLIGKTDTSTVASSSVGSNDRDRQNSVGKSVPPDSIGNELTTTTGSAGNDALATTGSKQTSTDENPFDESTMDGTNSTQSSQEVGTIDVETIRLDERIVILEATVRTINSRKQQVLTEYEVRSQAVQAYQTRLAGLEQRRKDLKETLASQTRLQEDLRRSIQKSQHHLDRLVSPDAPFSLDEVIKLADTMEIEDTVQLAPISQVLTSEVVMSDMDGDFDIVSLVDGRDQKAHAARMKLFWISGKDPSQRVGSFLPILDSRELIMTLLRISSSEVLAADMSEHGWQYRRECLWNTCCDIRLLSPESLDEELPSDEEEPSPGRRGTHLLDPAVQLCPYELSGECHDDNCAYQHLRARGQWPLLPRELLPLPALSFLVRKETKKNPNELSHQASSTGDGSDNEVAVSSDAENEGGREKGDQDALRGNEDFVPLPPPDLETNKPRTTLSTTCEGIDNLYIDQQYSDFELKTYAWITRRSLGEIPNQRLTFSSLFQIASSFVKWTPGKATFNDEVDPGSKPEAFLFVSRLINHVCVAIYAGRFDTTVDLLRSAKNMCDGWDQNASSEDLVRDISLAFIEKMTEIESRSFTYDLSRYSNIFDTSFETQRSGVTLVSILEELSASEEKITPEVFRKVKSELLPLVHCKRSAEDQDSEWTERDILRFIKHDAFSWKQECDVDQEESLLLFIDYTIEDLLKGTELRENLSKAPSMRFIVDRVLPLSFRLFRELVNSGLKAGWKPTRVFRKGITLLAQVVFGSLENASKGTRVDAKIGHLKTDCTDLFTSIDKALSRVRTEFSHYPPLDLLLTPLFAANIALATTFRIYDRAHQRLQGLLSMMNGTSISLCALSELLWSQLIQLESALPRRVLTSDEKEARIGKDASTGSVLSSESKQAHNSIAREVEARKVYPHHVAIRNDWHLLDALSKGVDASLLIALQGVWRRLSGDNSPSPMISFALVDKQLSHRETRGKSCRLGSTVPYSLLMAGTSMISLKLVRVGLTKLPVKFGHYFSKLRRLDVSENNLEDIPRSLFTISTLESLNISKNQISTLPPKIALPRLRIFEARENNLKELPFQLVCCHELEVLHLDGNPLEQSVFTLASKLPKLFDFSHS